MEPDTAAALARGSAPEPLPYQRTGISFLTARTRALLADDAGLGKSMQMIRAADALGCGRLLVVAPAVAIGSWQVQLAEWDTLAREVCVFHPSQPIPKTPRLALLVSAQWLSRPRAAEILGAALGETAPMDIAIVDEAHLFKSPVAARTRALYGRTGRLVDGVLAKTPRRWLATATPTPLGHVGEMWPHLRALFPDVLLNLFGGQMPNRFQFEARFCKVVETRFGKVIDGNNPDTIGDLRKALAPFLLMRRKNDVLAELPPIIADVLPLDTGFRPSPDDAFGLGLSDQQVDAMSDADVLALLNAKSDRWAGQSAGEDADGPGSVRQRLGLLKEKASREWVRDFLDSDPDRKLLVFAHHRSVLDAVMAEHAEFNPVIIHGGTSVADRERNVRVFQTDPRVRLFVGQNTAAGVAITLTAADTVLLLEPAASPDLNYQIISRAHRLGQKSVVRAVFAYDQNVPLERRHVRILRRRAADNAAMFGHTTPGVV